jgi:predicted AAA+ superfamily ATPase
MKADYLQRNIDGILLAWSKEKPPDRKPLLLRGARQVGKSSALRQLGKQFKYFVEINFDENKEVRSFFDSSLSPGEICEQLALYCRTPIIPGETLLFLDEIQSCPLYAIGNVVRS